MTRTIVAALAVLILVGSATGQGETAPAAEGQHLAMARKMLDEAVLMARSHMLEEAEAFLRRTIILAPESSTAREAQLVLAEICIRQGRFEEAGSILTNVREIQPKLAERTAHLLAVLEAARKGRTLRLAAFDARKLAIEAEARAAIAEARARLLQEGVPTAEIERHLGEIEHRTKADLEQLWVEREAVRTGAPPRPGDPRDPASALAEAFRARGMSAKEAEEEAARRVAQIEEARRQLEENRTVLEELERFRAAVGGESSVDWKQRYARARKSMADARRRLVEIEKARMANRPVPARAPDDVRETVLERLLEELKRAHGPHFGHTHDIAMEEIERAIAALRASQDPRAEPGEKEHPRDGLEERVDRIERQLEEMRQLLERALEDR